MAAFSPSGGSAGGGTGTDTSGDPTVHIVREMIELQTGAILILNSPGVVLVTDGNLGKFLKVHTGSTAEYT